MKQPILTIGSSIKSLFCNILDLVFPNFCAICKKNIERNELCCSACYVNFTNLCSKKVHNSTQELEVFSMFAYSQMTKKLVLSKFWQDTTSLFKAGFSLKQCPYLLETLQSQDIKNWIIVPVPLHWTRELLRGFNQAKIIADGFGSATNFEVVNLISRNRRTKFQSNTDSKTERINNLANAFVLNTMHIVGRTEDYFKQKYGELGVILADDLLTSGATLLECAKVIQKKVNPKKIIGLTLCR